MLVTRECEPGVDDDDLVPELVDGQVLPDLTEPPERDDSQRIHAAQSIARPGAAGDANSPFRGEWVHPSGGGCPGPCLLTVMRLAAERDSTPKGATCCGISGCTGSAAWRWASRFFCNASNGRKVGPSAP